MLQTSRIDPKIHFFSLRTLPFSYSFRAYTIQPSIIQKFLCVSVAHEISRDTSFTRKLKMRKVKLKMETFWIKEHQKHHWGAANEFWIKSFLEFNKFRSKKWKKNSLIELLKKMKCMKNFLFRGIFRDFNWKLITKNCACEGVLKQK